MKTLYNLLALAAITVVLILSGLVGYLLVSGSLNAESAATIAAALRGEKPVPEGTTTAPAPAPATQPAKELVKVVPTTDLSSFAELQASLRERQERVIQDKLARLRAAQLKLIQDRERFEQEVALFHQQVVANEKVRKEKGFTKALAMYTQMPPKQAKEHFMKLDIDVVVRDLMNMKDRDVAKILKEFREPAEQERSRQIIDRISAQKVVMAQNQQNQKSQ